MQPSPAVDFSPSTTSTGALRTITVAWRIYFLVVAGATTIVTGGVSVGTDTIDVQQIRGTNANDTYTVNGSYTGADGLRNQFEGMAAGDDIITGNGSTRIAFSRAMRSHRQLLGHRIFMQGRS